eukprot:scaffold12967_cov120-Isochrysis_galbana.AAC.8
MSTRPSRSPDPAAPPRAGGTSALPSGHCCRANAGQMGSHTSAWLFQPNRPCAPALSSEYLKAASLKVILLLWISSLMRMASLCFCSRMCRHS